jgi:hypothetical protein
MPMFDLWRDWIDAGFLAAEAQADRMIFAQFACNHLILDTKWGAGEGSRQTQRCRSRLQQSAAHCPPRRRVADQRRPVAALPVTPKSADLLPRAAASNPSAASPRFSNSRTADARLGILRLGPRS